MAGTGDELGDIENWDFTTCKEKIIDLQAGRERRLESTERLQEKLKALNNELAARRLEADQRRMELKEVQDLNRQKQEQLRDMGDVVAVDKREEDLAKVRNCVDALVIAKASGGKKEKQRTKQGFRVFDETELMVEKPLEGQGKEQPVDTVLVTHQKPNSDEVRYHLTYRVAKDTPSKKLREDACNYWNLSEVEYVLLTVENSKVHDDLILQHCFRPNERCQLILAPKDPTRTAIHEKEFEATCPKVGKGSRTKANKKVPVEETSKRQGSNQDFYDWMQKTKPGIWDFMIQRDQNVVDHLTRIRLSSIIIYTLIAMLCASIIFIVAGPGKLYYMRYGPLYHLTASYMDEQSKVQVPAFDDIRTQEEAWYWLTHTVPAHLMDPASDLRLNNYIVGNLRVRMQQVKFPDQATCKPAGMAPSNYVCYEQDYTALTAGDENLEFIQHYWDGYLNTTTTTALPGGGRLLNVDALDSDVAAQDAVAESEEKRRLTYSMAPWTQLSQYYKSDGSYSGNYTGPGALDGEVSVSGRKGRRTTNPWEFQTAAVNAEEHKMEQVVGKVQSYDASGYSVDYNLQYYDLALVKAAYRKDMLALRERGWFTRRTRSIIVQYTLYGPNYDLWVSSEFAVEMRASSLAIPSKHINPYMASVYNIEDAVALFWMDTVRLVFCVYVGIIQIWLEIKFCKKREQSIWTNYILTPFFLCDIGIFIIASVVYVLRDIMMGLVFKNKELLNDILPKAFLSTASYAAMFQGQLACEAPLFALVLWRLLSFLRINRHIYLVWTAMWECGKLFLPFLLVFVPVTFGFTLWSHTLWHSMDKTFTSVPKSFTSIVMMALGDIDKEKLFVSSRSTTYVFALVFYVAVYIFVINAWIAVIVHVYQAVRVKAGFVPKDFRWQEKHYVVWMLWTPVARFYFTHLRPRIDRPKRFVTLEDDDD